MDELLPGVSDRVAPDADADADVAEGRPDTFLQYQHQVKGSGACASESARSAGSTSCLCPPELRDTVNALLEQKKTFVCQIHHQQRQIEELTAQVSSGAPSCMAFSSRAQQELRFSLPAAEGSDRAEGGPGNG